MATLITNASGNLTGNIHALTDTASSLQMVRGYNANGWGAGTVTSDPFTVTAGAVIDGVMLWTRLSSLASTGTVQLELLKGGVSQASVTVGKTDIPDAYTQYHVPTFFKFTGTATGDGAANWALRLTMTGTGNFEARYFNAGGNWTRALRTTTTRAPAAGDDLFLLGELTGNGTHNAFNIAMDSVTPTAYGSGIQYNANSTIGAGVYIACWATLSYPTTAGINSVLRINGDMNVMQWGTLNVGSIGAEIPPSSTAILEFMQTAGDSQFGLNCMESAVINIAGSPRTAGKPIVKAKLTADVTMLPNVIGAGNGVNCTIPTSGVEPTGQSAILMPTIVDNTTNGPHGWYFNGPAVTNVTHTATVWVARGDGTNNRYYRFYVGNNNVYANITNGFYADFDLQTGALIGSVTAVGNGVAISASIVPCGYGFILRMTGVCSTAATTVYVHGYAMSAPGTVNYVGNGTRCWHYKDPQMVVGTSIPDTVFNIDADTGWLNGDAAIVCGTTLTRNHSNLYALSTNAGAASFTTTMYPWNIHNGLEPIRAEVGLLTRNVKIRTAPNSFYPNQWFTYVYICAVSSFSASWAEICFLNQGPSSSISSNWREGMELDCSGYAPPITGPKRFNYCSIHDSKQCLLGINGSTYSNLVFSNNICWYATSYSNSFIIPAIGADDWVADNNLFVRTGNVAVGDVGGIFTNNTIVGCDGSPYYSEGGGSLKKIGSFNNNTIHGSSVGFDIGGYIAGEITNYKAWRNNQWGVRLNSGCLSNLTMVNPTIFGNWYNNNIANFEVNTDVVNIRGGTICGDVLTTSQFAFKINRDGLTRLNISDLDMSGVSSNGVYAPHQVHDVWMNGSYSSCNIHGVFYNCKFGAVIPISPFHYVGAGAALGFMNNNQIIGNNRTETGQGQIRLDTAFYHGTSPSVRMSPISNAFKLESAPIGDGELVAVNDGQTATVSVWIRKDPTYIGAQPRLMLRANPALGVTIDTVLATATGTTGTQAYAALDNRVSNMVLSNNNLTATNGIGNLINSDIGARVGNPAGEKSTGKVYIELRYDAINNINASFGVAPATTTYGGFGNTCTGSGAGIGSNGWVYVNGSSLINLGGVVVGAVWGIAYDFDNHLMWVRNSPTGNWNGNASYNPTTAIGGVAIPALSFAPMLAYIINSLVIGNATTFNFGATAFAGAVPSGFSPGWTMAAGTPGTGTWAMLTGTTPVAHGDGVFEFYVDCDSTAGFINVDDWLPSTTMVGYAPVNIIAPTTNSALNVGQVLTTTNGSWVGAPTPTLTVQWKRGGVDIAGATSTSYMLVTADIGAVITATTTATNTVGSTSATTAGQGPILAAFNPAMLPGLVAWYDASLVGNFGLTGSQVNTFNDMSGLNHQMQWTGFGKPLYSATAFNGSYPTLVIDTVQGSAMQATPFAMGNGNTLTVCAVTTQAGGSSNASARFVAYAAPTLQDHNSVNSWCLNFAGALNNIRFTRNSVDLGGTAPGGATTPHVIVVTMRSDGFTTMYIDGTVIATGTLSSGSNWITGGTLNIGRQSPSGSAYITAPFSEVLVTTAYSDLSTVIQLTNFEKIKWDFALTGAAPMNINVAASISGSIIVGSTLTATNGTWTTTPTFTYQWKRNGVNISGATANTYVTVSGDIGATITLAITAVNSFGSTVVTTAGIVIISNPATDFLARTTGLNTLHQNAITALITKLANDGVWPKYDVLRVYVQQDQTTALLNLVANNYNGTLIGAPTFVADRGMTGVEGSATVGINSNYNQTTAVAPKYTTNAGHLAMWLVNNTAGVPYLGYANASSSSVLYLLKYTGDQNLYPRINATGNSGGNIGNYSAQGLITANRTGSGTVDTYRNKLIVSSGAGIGALALLNMNFYELGINSNGAMSGSGNTFWMCSWGAMLTATDIANVNDAFRTYFMALGAISATDAVTGIVKWDALSSQSTTLSNSNLTTTSAGGGADHGVHADDGYGKLTGKYYFETTFTTLAGGADTGIGVGLVTSVYGGMGQSGSTGVIMFTGTGNIWSNGANTGTSMGARATSDVICVAVDLDNRRAWFRVGAAGNWNNSGTANPVTNVGGMVIPAGLMVPWATFNLSGNVWTTNFGGTAFVGTAPSGFGNWTA